jgi:transposase
MLEVDENGKKKRRPACAKCGGTGYVYLWSVERVRGRTWYCDRCKLSWLDADPIAARVIAAGVPEPIGTSPSPVSHGEPSLTVLRTTVVVSSESLSAVGLGLMNRNR